MQEDKNKHLPEYVREMFKIIGRQNTMLLLGKWGPDWIYIPSVRNLTEKHPIAQIIGMEDAIELCREYHTHTFNVYRFKKERRDYRNKKVVEMVSSGNKVSATAIMFNITVQSVYNILRKEQYGIAQIRRKRKRGQLSLFTTLPSTRTKKLARRSPINPPVIQLRIYTQLFLFKEV